VVFEQDPANLLKEVANGSWFGQMVYGQILDTINNEWIGLEDIKYESMAANTKNEWMNECMNKSLRV